MTMMKMPDGHIKVATDNGEPCNRLSNEAWTGVTVYQLNGPTRKEYGMFANLLAKKVARQQKNMIKKKKPDVSERHLSLHEKELFMQAKVKELKSFFENGVWEFQTTREADPTRPEPKPGSLFVAMRTKMPSKDIWLLQLPPLQDSADLISSQQPLRWDGLGGQLMSKLLFSKVKPRSENFGFDFLQKHLPSWALHLTPE